MTRGLGEKVEQRVTRAGMKMQRSEAASPSERQTSMQTGGHTVYTLSPLLLFLSPCLRSLSGITLTVMYLKVKCISHVLHEKNGACAKRHGKHTEKNNGWKDYRQIICGFHCKSIIRASIHVRQDHAVGSAERMRGSWIKTQQEAEGTRVGGQISNK